MYLADRDLAVILDQINVAIEDGAEPFDPETQIQPASLDLRLGHVFWRPKRRMTVDLRRSRLLEIQPRRYYGRIRLAFGETITVRPREMLLGRTLEEFSVPNGYAAELTGRSSFARLGLMVSATGGFINPGWRGRMPLQLVNHGPNPVRLVAGLPICQVRYVKLTSLADRPYGHEALQSKYVNDDGGPSYWWRDKRIRSLHERLSERVVEQRIQQEIERTVGSREPEVIERLEKLVGRMRVDDLQNAQDVLERFAKSEDRRRTLRRWAINLSRGSFTLGISSSLWVLNKVPPVQWWHWAVWGGALASLALSVYALRTEVGDHLVLLCQIRSGRCRRSCMMMSN
jgi:deoxycytidine triphosphate deaminase